MPELAAEMNLSRERVRQLYELFDVKRPNFNEMKVRRGQEYLEKLKRLAESGILRHDAARELGISSATLRAHSKVFGMHFQTRREYCLALEAKGVRECCRCHVVKSLDEFCLHCSERLGRSRTCRQCMGEYRAKRWPLSGTPTA